MAEKQYSIMQSLMHDGAWFRFPKSFLKIMSRDEALVLAFLANHSSRVKCHERKGWFFCKMKTIMSELCMSGNAQTRIMGSLERNGFIDTKMKVDRSSSNLIYHRWIFIRWGRIERELYGAEVFDIVHAPDENDDWSVPEGEEVYENDENP